MNESDKGEGEGVEEMAKTVEIHLDRKPWMKTTMKPMSEMREEASRDGERLRKELEESKPDWLKRWQAEAGTAESTGSAAEMESAEGKAKPTKKAR